jgi:hypothetical protein
MIGTWFIAGVAFGFKAFFAALTFLLCAAIVTPLLVLVAGLVVGLLARLFGWENDDGVGRD